MNRLRELREKRGFSLRKVGDDLKISFVTIGQYERGERQPDNDMLLVLADYYGVTVDELLRDKNQPSQKSVYIAPDYIETYEEAVEFLKSLNLLRAYGGLDVRQKTQEEIINLARTLHSVLKMQGAI